MGVGEIRCWGRKLWEDQPESEVGSLANRNQVFDSLRSR